MSTPIVLDCDPGHARRDRASSGRSLARTLRLGASAIVVERDPVPHSRRPSRGCVSCPSSVYLLARGEMRNLAAASGHQIQIMDLGLALQAHSLEALARDLSAFTPGYNRVPAAIDAAVAEQALATLSTVDVV